MNSPIVKKPAKIEHVANWFFGNFCARCARTDDENESYGKVCFDKIQVIVTKLKENGTKEITHKEFADLIRKGSTFCKPIKREFAECPICRALGVPQRRF